jgi:hypothetical protein
VNLDALVPEGDTRDKRRIVKESGGGVKTKEQIRAEWVSTNPAISLDHIKMAKELLRLVGDPTGEDSGLLPCYRSDGTCAWVCPGDGPSRMSDPSNPRSCSQMFLDEGYECCLASLEHLLTNEKK